MNKDSKARSLIDTLPPRSQVRLLLVCGVVVGSMLMAATLVSLVVWWLVRG